MPYDSHRKKLAFVFWSKWSLILAIELPLQYTLGQALSPIRKRVVRKWIQIPGGENL